MHADFSCTHAKAIHYPNSHVQMCEVFACWWFPCHTKLHVCKYLILKHRNSAWKEKNKCGVSSRELTAQHVNVKHQQRIQMSTHRPVNI
jgi:hypothetical protein